MTKQSIETIDRIIEALENCKNWNDAEITMQFDHQPREITEEGGMYASFTDGAKRWLFSIREKGFVQSDRPTRYNAALVARPNGDFVRWNDVKHKYFTSEIKNT